MDVKEVEEVVKSSRDPVELRARMQKWITSRLPEAAEPQVGEITSPSATGMSSETLLFDAEWTEEGARERRSFVARVAPEVADVPVFREYDLEKQFRAIRLAGEHSAVPVPGTRWLETDPAALGAPFFVMDRVEGRVPPDIMPYPFGSWLQEASREDQRALQDATVGVLVALHGIDRAQVDTRFLELDRPEATALQRQLGDWRDYQLWVADGRDFPVLEDAYRWLRENFPADEGEPVISWGDSRIGNILFDGFRPAAVLDWEMVGIGPRGLDVGWCIFLHDFFQDLATMAGVEGMPHFMRRDDVAEEYEKRSGVGVSDLHWHETFAAWRHGGVMARIHSRRVLFEGAEWPDAADDVIPHKALLRQMIGGE